MNTQVAMPSNNDNAFAPYMLSETDLSSRLAKYEGQVITQELKEAIINDTEEYIISCIIAYYSDHIFDTYENAYYTVYNSIINDCRSFGIEVEPLTQLTPSDTQIKLKHKNKIISINTVKENKPN